MRRVERFEDRKYVLRKEYNGVAIYKEKTPSGYFVSQSYLLVIAEGEHRGTKIQIMSFNNMCREEILDGIDMFNEDEMFYWTANKCDDGYVVHPNGKIDI